MAGFFIKYQPRGMALITLVIAALFILSAYAPSPLQRWQITGYSQGTTYQITYYAADSIVTQRQSDSLLSLLDNSVSLYQPSSLICQFNRSASGITIDEPFKVLVKKALEINHDTGGLVDITVKPLVDAWGFGVNKSAHFPDSAEVKAILQNVGSGKISLEGNFLHKTRPGVQLDLNGIAQGYAVDLLANLLERNHIYNYVAELGGELRIKGHRQPDGDAFKIGIEAIDDNDLNPAPLRKIISPGDGAITTSGNYRKHLEAGGRQISHIMDPHTGYPTQKDIISVTVWAKDAITADGYDNGFVAMGLKQTLNFLQKRTDIGAYIIYQKPNGAVADTVTAGFRGYQK
jgi:thiamine biosynthesis lipoprotein